MCLVRTDVEVAQRVLALLAVINRVYEDPPTDTRNWVNATGIDQYFSDQEREFFFADTVTVRDCIKFSWQTESVGLLIWALSGTKSMPTLKKKTDLSKVSGLTEMMQDAKKFIGSAKLREEAEILDLEESMEEAHWAVRDAQIHGKKLPRGVDPGIVLERRRATCWMLGMGDDWDNVEIDT